MLVIVINIQYPFMQQQDTLMFSPVLLPYFLQIIAFAISCHHFPPRNSGILMASEVLMNSILLFFQVQIICILTGILSILFYANIFYLLTIFSKRQNYFLIFLYHHLQYCLNLYNIALLIPVSFLKALFSLLQTIWS